MLDLATLTTETRNVDTMDLDRMTPEEFVRVMNREDHKVAEAVEKVLPQIAQTITWAVEALKKEDVSFMWVRGPVEGWEFWMPQNVLRPLEYHRTWWSGSLQGEPKL